MPVQNIVKAYNELIPVLENIVFSGQSGVPYGHYDFESVAIHEIGHALGMGHPNIGGSPASDPVTEFTESTEGSNGVFDRNAGADGIPGSGDDARGDDVNLCYFRIDNNDPFEIASIVDSTTYSRDVSDLPSGHNFPAHSNRDLWESINGIDNGESVMQQGSMAGEAHRQLGPEDVATLLYAMSGFDEREGTSDDYTFTLVYAGFTADADIVIDFDSSQTSFAITKIRALVWGDHYVLTQCHVYFNDSYSWFFNGEPANFEPEILDQYYVLYSRGNSRHNPPVGPGRARPRQRLSGRLRPFGAKRLQLCAKRQYHHPERGVHGRSLRTCHRKRRLCRQRSFQRRRPCDRSERSAGHYRPGDALHRRRHSHRHRLERPDRHGPGRPLPRRLHPFYSFGSELYPVGEHRGPCGELFRHSPGACGLSTTATTTARSTTCKWKCSLSTTRRKLSARRNSSPR